MAALGKQPWVGSDAPMDRVIVLPSRSMAATFLAKKTSVVVKRKEMITLSIKSTQNTLKQMPNLENPNMLCL